MGCPLVEMRAAKREPDTRRSLAKHRPQHLCLILVDDKALSLRHVRTPFHRTLNPTLTKSIQGGGSQVVVRDAAGGHAGG